MLVSIRRRASAFRSVHVDPRVAQGFRVRGGAKRVGDGKPFRGPPLDGGRSVAERAPKDAVRGWVVVFDHEGPPMCDHAACWNARRADIGQRAEPCSAHQEARFDVCGTGAVGETGLSRSGESPAAQAQIRVERENLELRARFGAVTGCTHRRRRLATSRQSPRSAWGHVRRRRTGSVLCRSAKVRCGRGEFRHPIHRGCRRNMKDMSGLKSFRGAYLVNIFLTRTPANRESAFQPIDNRRTFPLPPSGIPW